MQSCYLVRLIPVLLFPVLHFQRPRVDEQRHFFSKKKDQSAVSLRQLGFLLNRGHKYDSVRTSLARICYEFPIRFSYNICINSALLARRCRAFVARCGDGRVVLMITALRLPWQLDTMQRQRRRRRRHLWHATHDCVSPYVDIILHRGRF